MYMPPQSQQPCPLPNQYNRKDCDGRIILMKYSISVNLLNKTIDD